MSCLDECIKAHLDKNCNAVFKKIDKIAVLDIPQNIIRQRKPEKFVYEIDETGVIIYIDGVKEVIPCPDYACRPFITMDIIKKMDSMGYSMTLIKIYDGEELVENDKDIPTKTAANLLNEPEKRQSQILEKELYGCLPVFFGEEDMTPSDKVMEGLEVIESYYDKE